MALLLTVAMLVTVDDPKEAPKGTPAPLKGDWRIIFATDGKGFITCATAGLILKIGDDTVEWKEIPKFADKPGKSAIVTQGKDNEGTLEFKEGDKVYKGLYRVTETKDDKEKRLDVLLGAAGKLAPAAFPKDPLKLPADASFKMQCDRRQK